MGLTATRLKADTRQLKQFSKEMEKIQEGQLQSFSEKTIRELAAIELALIIKRTPVGQYSAGSGKNGGTLRRNWRVGQVVQVGDGYEVEIVNETYYASYVESGHRTVNHKGWVKGRFMMKLSEQEMERYGPKIIERRLTAFLEEALNGK